MVDYVADIRCAAVSDGLQVQKKGPKNAEEASAMHKDLMAQENAILSKNTQLWDKVFMAADKGMAMIEDGKNYGDFLLKTIESAKEQFTADELKLLKAEAEKIREIENELTKLEEKFPEIAKKTPSESTTSIPAEGNIGTKKFPSFVGKDLEGNDVTSDELFSRQCCHGGEFLVYHLRAVRRGNCRA